MNKEEKIEFEAKAKKYIELKRQEQALAEEIARIEEDLKKFIPPNGLVTVEMKGIKRMTFDRPYFDDGRLKLDNPTLHSRYIRRVSQDYLKLVEASVKKSRRKEIKDL